MADDYALYTEIKAANGGKSWSEWEDDYRLRDECAGKNSPKRIRRDPVPEVYAV